MHVMSSLTAGSAVAMGTALLFGGLSLSTCTQNAGPVDQINSPTGRYTVRISGPRNRPTLPLVTNVVTAEIRRNDSGAHTTRLALHLADSFDTGFESLHGKPEWQAENVLRLPRGSGVSHGPPGRDTRLVFENGSDTAIDVAEVCAADLLLLLDVPAHSDVAVPVSSPPSVHAASVMVTLWNRYGKEVLFNTETLDVSDRSHLTFRVSVERSGISIRADK